MYDNVQDVSSTTTFYLFRDVTANENLTVSVQMRNSFGPGPASIVHVATPKEVKGKLWKKLFKRGSDRVQFHSFRKSTTYFNIGHPPRNIPVGVTIW